MISKQKGNIGEAVILAEFTKRGIQVSIPFGDSARYDLIAEFNGKLNKIQVKYSNTMIDEETIMCRSASSLNHTTNKHLNTYENDIDYFAFYLAKWDKCILVPVDKIGSNTAFYVKSKMGKKHNPNTHIVDDYTFDKIIKD